MMNNQLMTTDVFVWAFQMIKISFCKQFLSDFSISDFCLKVQGALLEEWVPGSFEWVSFLLVIFLVC